MSYTVTLSWNDGSPNSVDLHNYDGNNLLLQEGFTKSETLHSNLNPTQDRANFSIKWNPTIANTLLTIDPEIEVSVQILKDGAAWFYGHVRPVTGWIVTNDPQSRIDIEVLDNSWKLKRELSSAYTATSITVSAAVTALLELAGYTSSWYSVPTISDVIGDILEEKNKKTYYDIISELLYSYGYLFYFDITGVFRAYDFSVSSTPSTVGTFDESNTLYDGQLGVERAIDDYDGVEATYYSLRSVERIPILQVRNKEYSGSTSFSDSFDHNLTSTLRGNEVTEIFGFAGDELNGGRVVKASSFLASLWLYGDLVFGGGETWSYSLDVRSVVPDVSPDVWLPLFSPGTYAADNYPSDFAIWKPRRIDGQPDTLTAAGVETTITLSCDEDGTSISIATGSGGVPAPTEFEIFYLGILADVLYTVKMDPYRTNSSAVNPLKISGDYLYSSTAAGRLANILERRLSASQYRYTLQSRDVVGVGDYVSLQNTYLNIDTTARIISRRLVDVEADIYEYSLEGVAELGSLFGSVTSGSGIAQLPPGILSGGIEGAANGLSSDGVIIKAIEGNRLTTSANPGETGLFFDSRFLGFYDADTQEWVARIQNDDGTGKFRVGDSDEYMEWDGDSLNIQGTAQSSNYVEGSAGWKIDIDGTAEFDAANIRGTITATTGAIGGWDVTATALEATDDSVSIRSDLRRMEVRDALDVTKVAVGYLSGVSDYEATDFGLYIGQGASVGFSSGAAFEDGDYLINSDAAFIAESGGVESVRLGSLGSGDIGLDIGGMKFGALLGGGGASGTFEAVTGGGGATGTFDPVLGGGNARYGTNSGLLYSLADDRLYLTGTLVGVDGEFSGSLKAATGTFAGSLKAATGTFAGSLSAATGTFSGELQAASGTFAGLVSGGSINIGGGDFTVDSSGNVTAANIDIEGGAIDGDLDITGSIRASTYSNSGTGAYTYINKDLARFGFKYTTGLFDDETSIQLVGNRFRHEKTVSGFWEGRADMQWEDPTSSTNDDYIFSVEGRSVIGITGTLKIDAHLELPKVASSASGGRVWRDASGYLRIG